MVLPASGADTICFAVSEVLRPAELHCVLEKLQM